MARLVAAALLIVAASAALDPPDDSWEQIGLFSCGQVTAKQQYVEKLLARPDAAEAIEAEAVRRPLFRSWLAAAYGNLRGRDAIPTLRSWEWPSGVPPDSAMAHALGQTAYISSTRPAVRSINCRSDHPGIVSTG